jgi:protein phosphatase
MTLPAEGGVLRVGVVSTRGHVRRHNEDNFYVPGLPSLQNMASMAGGGNGPTDEVPAATAVPGPSGLFIVADGMGGQLAGERASQMAVEIIPVELAPKLTSELDDNEVIRVIRETIARANDEIMAQSHLQPEYSSMGTTVGLALFRDGRAFILGEGDSRIYHLHDGKFEQLTKDHSLAHALAEHRTISPEEVENHRFKNILYRYLGCKEVSEDPGEVRVIPYRRGDRFLLATDGLTGVVRDSVIIDVLRSHDDPQRAAQQLINRALENQSKDNITCIVIQVV